MTAPVVVVGHVGRDLALQVDRVPDQGGTAPVHTRRELPGGKGYNQALALVQLGLHAAVVAAVGDDGAGRWVMECARRDGLDAAAIAVRPETRTSLVVSAVAPDGGWRYLEDMPGPTFVQGGDVEARLALIESCAVLSLQLQEPAGPLLVAARAARDRGRLVVGHLGGRPDLTPAMVAREAARLAATARSADP